MRVLITNRTLTERSGTETYVRDLVLALAARDHAPSVYTPEPGVPADELAAAGIPVHRTLADVETPDVVHGHHTRPALEALLHFRNVPALYVCHDRTFPGDAPPCFPRVYRHVAVDDHCRERVVEAGVPEPRIRVVPNAVDLARFAPRGPLPERPRRSLVFSNYANERTQLPAIEAACAQLGLPLDVIGVYAGGSVANPEALLGRYDLVFAKARCALEAMAVGCAVVLCDFGGLGPMVTRAEVEALRRWNFGRRTLQRPLDAALIRAEIERYDARDAAEVSRWVRANAGLDASVDALVALYGEVIAEHRRAPAVSPRAEARVARRAIRATETRRARLRRVPVLGRSLYLLKRAAMSLASLSG